MQPANPAPNASPMASAIGCLKGEHSSYAIALKSLVAHLDFARRHPHAPRLEVFTAGLGFIETFIDHFHHPKEDELLFKALRHRSREADEVLRELQYDHAHAESTLSKLKSSLQHVLSHGVATLDVFGESLEHYKRGQFAHMDLEENGVIPLARRLLTHEDWRDIDRGFRANRDPLFGAVRGGKFGALFNAGTAG